MVGWWQSQKVQATPRADLSRLPNSGRVEKEQGEGHPGNLVAGGMPRRDFFLRVCLPPAPKGGLETRFVPSAHNQIIDPI
jgi:hypothetical protein